jgi:hypothetical protein
MKRLCALLLALYALFFLLPASGMISALAQNGDQPLYKAFSTISFHIRNIPEDGGRHIKEVGSHKALLVYEYGDLWCTVKYGEVTGYCKTKWLYRFRSLKPGEALVPGFLRQEGFARVISPFHVSVPGYGGNDFKTGSILSVHQWNGQSASIHMMRSIASFDAGCISYTPYVPFENAEKGDVIGGFTTYYNEKTGGRLSKNRQWNVQLACEFVSGAVVRVGEAFSYKKLCAPFKKGNGYRMAPNISNDGQGYGGGVCQLTTTIYNAVLNLPLQIGEWSLHRDIGVAYIPRGFDAAVGSYSDFTFTNTIPYDIRLEAMPQNGVLTVLIYRW